MANEYTATRDETQPAEYEFCPMCGQKLRGRLEEKEDFKVHMNMTDKEISLVITMK